MMTCSVVIPVHNEGENIERFFMEFWDSIEDLRPRIAEVLLVENGSTDGSFMACKKIENRFPSIVKVHKIPFPSYGEAVKQGILKACGDAVSVLEADVLDVGFLSSSLETIEQKQADFVVASKRHPESLDRRPFKRRVLTFLFNVYLKSHFRFPGTDTHGLKTIRGDVGKALCGFSMTGGEVFQTEIVLLAYRLGYNVIELPLRIREMRGTKVSIRKRMPKVLNIIRELEASLGRFPAKKQTN